MSALLGCIADDFTGGTDLAGMLVKSGMRTVQMIGVPERPLPDGIDAVVIALKSRTAPVDDAVAESLAALRYLQAAGCHQFYFKYCSTFDSTPCGNIGPVAEALMDALGTDFTIACPAFPANQRTIYKGYLFVGERAVERERHARPPAYAHDRRQSGPGAATAGDAQGWAGRLRHRVEGSATPSPRASARFGGRAAASPSSTPSRIDDLAWNSVLRARTWFWSPAGSGRRARAAGRASETRAFLVESIVRADALPGVDGLTSRGRGQLLDGDTPAGGRHARALSRVPSASRRSR